MAYKAQRPKMQKLAYWKPALSIRNQNSSHLQDFRNAFSTKDRVKTESESGQPRPQYIFSLKEEGKNFSEGEVESQGVFVAMNITISTFSPIISPNELRLRI